MSEHEGLRRLGMWASGGLALIATVATSAESCPLGTQFDETVALDATTPERTLRFLVRTSHVPGVGVNVTLAPSGSTDANIEVVLLHEGPTNQQDEFRTLHAAPGTTATTRLRGSPTFRLGLNSLTAEALNVQVQVSANIDDCDEDRFVTIDRE